MPDMNDIRRMKKRGLATTETKVVIDTSRMSARMRNNIIRCARTLVLTKAGWETRKITEALVEHLGLDLPFVYVRGGRWSYAYTPAVGKDEVEHCLALANAARTAARMHGKTVYVSGGIGVTGGGCVGMYETGMGEKDVAEFIYNTTTQHLLTDKRKADVERFITALTEGVRIEFTTTDL